MRKEKIITVKKDVRINEDIILEKGDKIRVLEGWKNSDMNDFSYLKKMFDAVSMHGQSGFKNWDMEWGDFLVREAYIYDETYCTISICKRDNEYFELGCHSFERDMEDDEELNIQNYDYDDLTVLANFDETGIDELSRVLKKYNLDNNFIQAFNDNKDKIVDL